MSKQEIIAAVKEQIRSVIKLMAREGMAQRGAALMAFSNAQRDLGRKGVPSNEAHVLLRDAQIDVLRSELSREAKLQLADA